MLWIRNHSFEQAHAAHAHNSDYDVNESYSLYRRALIDITTVSPSYSNDEQSGSFTLNKICDYTQNYANFARNHQNLLLSLFGTYIDREDLVWGAAEEINSITGREFESLAYYRHNDNPNLTGNQLIYGLLNDPGECWSSDRYDFCMWSLSKFYKIFRDIVAKKMDEQRCERITEEKILSLMILGRKLSFTLADDGRFEEFDSAFSRLIRNKCR